MDDEERKYRLQKLSSKDDDAAVSPFFAKLTNQYQKVEKFFDYGVETDEETLYRVMDEDGDVHFCTQEISVDDEDRDPIEKPYPSFEVFWRKFTRFDKWFYYYPVFVHPSIKSFIKQELQQLDGNVLFDEGKRKHWQSCLNLD